ncbi:hypothetical protein HY480_05185 [Candidatus Uhrbacteria bacterium]|nr:hypothetical protein [Candidatus Uhrbacteria bacterium]
MKRKELGRGGIERMKQKLFGDRPYTSLWYGEMVDAPDDVVRLFEMLPKESIAGLGFSLDEQITAARGFVPILTLRWDYVLDRDVVDADLWTFSPPGKRTYRYVIEYCRPDVIRILRDGIIQIIADRESDRNAKIQLSHRGIQKNVLFPLRTGQRLVSMYIGHEPIPGIRPSA